jgi:hypothetical protein
MSYNITANADNRSIKTVNYTEIQTTTLTNGNAVEFALFNVQDHFRSSYAYNLKLISKSTSLQFDKLKIQAFCSSTPNENSLPPAFGTPFTNPIEISGERITWCGVGVSRGEVATLNGEVNPLLSTAIPDAFTKFNIATPTVVNEMLGEYNIHFKKLITYGELTKYIKFYATLEGHTAGSVDIKFGVIDGLPALPDVSLSMF